MRLLIPAVLLAAALFSSACEEDPLFPEQAMVQDTITLFSAARAETIGEPTAFDFIRFIAFPVELPGAASDWDVLLTEQNGQLVLAPSSAFPQLPNGARMTVVANRSLAEVERAPEDADQYTSDARPVQANQVYVVRLRSTGCTLFAKLQFIEIDPVAGRARFVFVANPNCGDRDLDFEDD